MPDTPLGVRVLSKFESVTHPQLILPVRLSTYSLDLSDGAPAKTIQTFALVDTGASKTCVCARLLDQLGCERYTLRKQRGVTDTRDVYQRYASLAMLDEDKVVFAEFSDIEVIEYNTFQDDHYKILLGMDLLGQFSMIQIKGFEISFGALLV